MKKLISVFIVLCMVLPYAAVAVSAEEKDDYSELFFGLMSDYLDSDYPGGKLIKSSYKLLGDTSNGYHVAFCASEYEPQWCESYNSNGEPTDVPDDLLERSQLEIHGIGIGEYFIRGEWFCGGPLSYFGLFCFDDKTCAAVDGVIRAQTVETLDNIPQLYLDAPVKELVKIVNKTETVHIYHIDDAYEDEGLSRYFTNVTVHGYYKKYLKDNYGYTGNSNCSVYGQHKNYYIFFGDECDASAAFETKIIDGYAVVSPMLYYPYHLGIYALDGEKVYTLEDAVEAGLFKMSDIATMIDAKLLIMGEVTSDGKVDMEDVVFLQKKLAFLYPDETTEQSEYNKFSADIDKNGEINMYDVVLIQRIIAKL